MDDRPRHKPHRRPVFPAAAHRVTRWLILLALWLQVAVAPTLAATPTAWQAQLDGQMVVCTAVGMVVLNPDGSRPAGDMADAGPSCVFCLPLLHAGLKPPAAPAMPPPALVGRSTIAIPAHPGPARPAEADAGHPPRAPPAP